MCVIFERQK